MPKKRQRRGTSSLSLSGGDSDAWVSIDSLTECIPPTPSQPLSPCQVMISDGLFSQVGDTGELLGDQQHSLTPIPAIETNPDKNVNPEVHSFEGFSPEQLDVITPVQHNSGKMPQNYNSINPTIILVEPSMEDEAKNKKVLANDLALSKGLANSAFGKASISYTKKDLGRNILVVTMKKHYEDVSPFLSVLEIGAWKVKCCLPANQITSVGAIGPFGKDTSSEELTEALIDAGFGGVTVERIYKGKDKIVTAFFKVVFNTTTLPQFVRIGYQQYRTGDELITPTLPNITVTQLVELLARTLTAVTCQDEDLNLKDLIIEIAKDTFKSQVLNTSANNERLLTAQPQYNDCSDPSNLMTTLDLPTTQLLPTHVIVGNFNAHNPLWEPAKSPNTTGRNLEQILQNNPSLALLTLPSLPTYFNVYQNSFSTLDLTFLSAVMQPIASISTEQDLGSDHYPIVTCIGVESSSVRYKSCPSWSRLDYAAPLYGKAVPSNLSKLKSIQNQCLRIATGCRKTTPITSLQIDANIPPLPLHREEIACRQERFNSARLFPSYSTKPNEGKQTSNSIEDDFPPLRLFAHARKAVTKRKVKNLEALAPRSATMKPDQDWSSVWPASRSYQPATVPLPVRMGTPPNKSSPSVDKWGNPELMKIPNFLHLTPPAVEKHCAAIRKYCSPWPEGVSYASAITMNTKNPNPNPVKKSKTKLPAHEPDPDAVFTDPGYFPMTVTKSSYLYSGPSIRDDRARVVTLKIRLEDLQLNDHSYDKLLRLVGDRYDRETHTISIIGDRCPLYSQNLDYCHYLLTVMLAEAQVGHL
ncbi:Ribosomal protein S24/S35 mitochondrial conserved domain [Trinorchestia longiramus]|nr:Ribosomal protein S24/S35 mitochondrial conserved domain [Trinorchestia longiramus]